MKKTFFHALMESYLYHVTPAGMASALKSKGIVKASTLLVAETLFAQSYQRFRQYEGKTQVQGCRLSLNRLVEMNNLSKSTVQVAISELENAGCIETGDTDKRGTFYCINNLIDLLESHAIKQKHTSRGKKTEPTPTSTEQQTMKKPAPVDPVVSKDLLDQLEKLDKKIKKLQKQLNEIANFGTTPQERIRNMRLGLQGKASPQASALTQQIVQLQQQRDQLRLEIERIKSLGRKCTAEDRAAQVRSKSELTQAVPKRPAKNHLKWLLRRLHELKVSNPTETAGEILWALEHGWYATNSIAQSWKPFQALSSALKLVENGRWRTPSGSKPWLYQQRLFSIMERV